MNCDPKTLTKINRLMTLANDGNTEECRTAAWMAVRLIFENNVKVGTPTGRILTQEEVYEEARDVVALGLGMMFNLNEVVSGETMMREFEEGIPPYETESRRKLLDRVIFLLRKFKKEGYLISIPGRHGGFKKAPGAYMKDTGEIVFHR